MGIGAFDDGYFEDFHTLQHAVEVAEHRYLSFDVFDERANRVAWRYKLSNGQFTQAVLWGRG